MSAAGSAPNDRRLRFVDYELAVLEVEAVSRTGAIEVTGPHPLLIAPTQISRYVHTFLLCGHTGECYDHLHIQFFGVDALFLEIHAHADLFAHPQQYEQLLGVPCQSGNRFDDDAVDLAFPAVGYQPIQLVPLFHLGSRDALIGINVDKLIFGILLGIVAVLADLCGEGVELVGRVTQHPAVWG